MQIVSKEYRDSMKSPLRERAFIKISFGLINQEVQTKATVTSGDFTYFSNKNIIFGENEESPTYATLEEQFTRVDGSMFFLPREGGAYLPTGIVSDKLVSESIFEMTISTNTIPLNLKGITIDFGENYPIDFDIVGSTGQVISYRNNDKSLFVSEDVMENTTSLTFRFMRMKNPDSRLRMNYIRFGYGLVYTNKDVLRSSLNSYVSPIGADVPQIDFSVTLKNTNQYFDIDNPKSAINFLETGQEMEIYYGYQLPSGTVEWVKGNHLYCGEWESDDFTATIRCQDIFRHMDSEYYKGLYYPNGISYYELAENVLLDAGISDYYIDPALKTLTTKNPIPRVTHKEALQIIANACRCVLSQTRDGQIRIKSNFVPTLSVSTPKQAPYSKVKAILSDTSKDEYGALATNYTVADGSMLFLPRKLNNNVRNTGFVSAEISGEDGTFTTSPSVTITQEVAHMWYGVRLIFGNALPSEFTISTFDNGAPVTELTISDGIEKNMLISHEFYDFDKMVITFTKTAEPHNRIVLNHFEFGDISNFTMTRTDMKNSPTAIKQELVKDIQVPCFSYQLGSKEENLISENVTATLGETMIFYIGEAAYNYRATFNGSAGNVTVLEQGAFYVKLKFNVAGTYKLDVFGWRYKVTERYAVKALNERGKTVKWSNPLISDIEIARDLADWLGDYYSAGVEYEYSTRGNPEIDTNDIIYQENKFVPKMEVTVYRQTLEFNQAFAGKVTTRRVGGNHGLVRT